MHFQASAFGRIVPSPPMENLRIVLIGNGNTAWHYAQLIQQLPGIKLWIAGRDANQAAQFASEVRAHHSSTITNLPTNWDLYILAIADDALPKVTQQLLEVSGLVVHTSGFVDLDVLKPLTRRGVLYPLQTLTKGTPIAANKIPLLVEAAHTSDVSFLMEFARKMTPQVFEVSSAVRKQLHVAAVFANNFTNHLMEKALQQLAATGLPTQILQPLIEETFRKALVLGPAAAQTGPAKRGDQRTMAGHKLLLNQADAELYQVVSNSIQKLYEGKL